MLKQVNGESSFYMANTCLGFVMIDLDGVIEKDWLALLEDNHDSFTIGTGTGWMFACLLELGNISRFLLVMCHLLRYHLSLSLFLSVVLWSFFPLSPCLHISVCLFFLSVFAFCLPSSFHPICSLSRQPFVFLSPSASQAIPETCKINNELL